MRPVFSTHRGLAGQIKRRAKGSKALGQDHKILLPLLQVEHSGKANAVGRSDLQPCV